MWALVFSPVAERAAGNEIQTMTTPYEHMTPQAYHAAVLRALRALQYRPLRDITADDAAAYHAYGDSPEDAAEMWAESTLYADEMEGSRYDHTGAGREIRMTAAELWLEQSLNEESAYYDAEERWYA